MNTIYGKWEEKEINLVISKLSQRLLFLQEPLSLWKPHFLPAGTGGCPPKHNLNQEALCDKQRHVDEIHPVLQVIAEMYEGFLDGSAAKEPTCMQETAQEIWVQSLGQEDPLEEEMATHSGNLA